MSDRYRLVVVIPTYNEASRLPATLAAVAAARDKLSDVELRWLVIADNGSTDNTIELALLAGAEHNLPLVLEPSPTPGKAGALAEAMPHAAAADPDADGVLFMDADNATDLGELAKFDLTRRTALQIASRHAPGARIFPVAGHRSSSRRLLSCGMRTLTRILLRLPMKDTQCGFKLFPRNMVAPLFGALRDRSWVFDAELLVRARRAGIEIIEVPVDWYEMPGSKVRPIADGIGSAIALLRIAATLTLERIGHRSPLQRTKDASY